MLRLLPETDLEKKLMCLGAVFVEENNVLDEIYQVVGSDLDSDKEMDPQIKSQVLDEIGEYFFRLDMNYSSEIKADCLEILQDFWMVQDRSSALQRLEDIRTQGHRTKFNVLKAALPSEGAIDMASLAKFKQIFSFDFEESQPAQMAEAEYQSLATWIQSTHKYLNEAGILGWDSARYIHLVRLCFIGGYLTDNEAWGEILKLAPLVEGRFASWMEFSQSFLIGRTFWSGTADPQVKSICERLLGHPASPWQFFSWT